MKDKFRSKDICSLLEVSQRQLTHWAECEVVNPEFSNASGYASKRIYSTRNLVEIEFVRQLSNVGISLTGIKALIKKIKTNPDGSVSAKNEDITIVISMDNIKDKITKKLLTFSIDKKHKV